jgi:hypothetical protein
MIFACCEKFVCAFIGHHDEFAINGEKRHCPRCGKNAAEVTFDNVHSVVAYDDTLFARALIENHESVVGRADCGCSHHAEDGVACVHDVRLARERHAEDPWTPDRQRDFELGVVEFHDVMFRRLEEGALSFEVAERFFARRLSASS